MTNKSKVSDVEGRAIQLRSEISTILKDNPELIHNTSNIKEKLRARLEKMNCKGTFEKESERISNLIRSWLREINKPKEIANRKARTLSMKLNYFIQ